MSKMLVKNTLRDISRTKARFISIMLIIMLGVGFLVGINSTAPSMYAVADKYYEDANLMDFRLLSTVGFTEEDVEAIEAVEGVDDVMPSYFCDVLLSGDAGDVVRLYAVPEAYGDNDVINELALKEGRLPEKENEIVIGANDFDNYSVGSTLAFDSPTEGEDLSNIIKNTEFTVVGIVDSPMYISFERGITNVGSGKVSAYMLISQENFCIERYTELYVTGSELRNYEPYSQEYTDARSELQKKLELAGSTRVQVFSEEEIDSAQASVDEAWITYEDEKTKVYNELADAQQKIDEGRAELKTETASAESALADAKEQIDKGRAELGVKRAEYEEQTTLAEQQIAQGEKDLAVAENELTKGKEEMKEGLFSAVSAFGITREQFDEIYGDRDMLTKEDVETLAGYAQLYKMSTDSQLSSVDQQIALIEEQCVENGTDPDTVPEYTQLTEKRDELSAVSTALGEFLTTGKNELTEGIEIITETETTLKESKEKLETAKAELESAKAVAEAEFANAESTLLSAEAEYASGVAELEKTRQKAEAELNDAQAELDSASAKAEEEFLKAERELKDAQTELDAVADPEWYYNDRDDNPGFASYVDNVERVNAVGKVFPVFFMLVAVLVCVTTLSRLVEEQRGDIGALTTLGYKKRDIIAKYVAYSVSATIIGAVVGIAVGVPVIPTVIFNAYRMLYSSMPELILTLDTASAVIATLIAMLCTSAVAFFTCNALLRFKPATLLRPKAPKPGKRILLERIGFLWNRMSFFTKVTARNIFRYKARFFMTVIGVAGCTALIVSGLGLYDSINDVVDKQFYEIFTYDVVIASDDSAEDNSELKEMIFSDNRFKNTALCRQSLVTVSSDSVEMSDDTYIAVPESIDDYTQIVNLRDRKSGEKIEFSTTGAVLTEKLAKTLGVTKGDTVTVTDEGREATFTVSDICENYMYGYVFVSPDVYEEKFGQSAQFDIFMCTGNIEAGFTEDSIGKDYLEAEGVLGVSFISSSITTFEDMITSLNYVVLVMIISAAALAFVVLYNLTNINIAERKREISTLKVLGFKDGETSAYIYRENILLTLFGVLAGLVLGVWLLNYIIITVEIDMVMFGRELYPLTFVWSALLTLVFAALVNIIMHIRLKKIDMVESLKSVE